MARTKTVTKTEQFVVGDEQTPDLPALSQMADAVAAGDTVVMASFDAVKAIGRIEAMDFSATVAQKVIAETALKIKEGKQYKGLPYQDENGNVRHVAHFEEFCDVFLKTSKRRVYELISNYNQLGGDLYEQAEKIGFRQRDYNALKALPEDDKKLVLQAIEADDKDKVVDLMQEIAARSQQAKEQAAKDKADLQGQLAAKDKVISDKNTLLDKKAEELAQIQAAHTALAHIDWPQAFKGYLEQLAITRKNLKHALGSLDVIRQSAMAIEPQSADEEAALDSAKSILATELVGLHNETAEMVEALGLSFDKTLGAYCEARIHLLSFPG